jgi:hypothetical protein
MTLESIEALKYMLNDKSFAGLGEIINARISKIDKRLDQISKNAVFEEVSQEIKQEGEGIEKCPSNDNERVRGITSQGKERRKWRH